MISFYDLRTGLFTGRRYAGPSPELNTPPGCGYKVGRFDAYTQRVSESGEVVAYQPPKPPDTELEVFTWNGSRWIGEPTTAAHWQQVRLQRDHKLAACDWVVTKAAEAGKPVPAPWVAYRQMLRDITLQPDPQKIHWPEEP